MARTIESLEKSLATYFRDVANGSQHPRRVACRQTIAARIGRQVYHARQSRPKFDGKPFAMLIRRVSVQPYDDVSGEDSQVRARVQFTLLGKDSTEVLSELGECVRIALVNYRGPIGANGYIGSAVTRRNNMLNPQRPVLGDDSWRFGWVVEMQVTFKQEAAPVG